MASGDLLRRGARRHENAQAFRAEAELRENLPLQRRGAEDFLRLGGSGSSQGTTAYVSEISQEPTQGPEGVTT